MRFILDARYVGPVPSGIGAYVAALARRLPALAPSERFRFWLHPAAPPDLAAPPNVASRVVPAPTNGLRTLLAPAWLDELEPDDVLHLPANILGRGLPCAAVVTVHDVMWLEQPEYCEPNPLMRAVRRRFFGSGIRRALAEASRILTVSEASAAAITRIAPEARARVRVTRNACEPRFRPPVDHAAAAARSAALLGTSAPFFLVLGRNQPSKAHALALAAFAHGALPSERLVLGQRQHRGRGLSRLADELQVAPRLHWLGPLPEADVVTLLQTATALLQPSLAEGFGMPALEAMACGCPVIASDIPPLREILGDAGLFVPAGDGAGLGRALRLLGDDPGRRTELRARGLERARRFSWDESARQTLAVYREAAAAGPRCTKPDGEASFRT